MTTSLSDTPLNYAKRGYTAAQACLVAQTDGWHDFVHGSKEKTYDAEQVISLVGEMTTAACEKAASLKGGVFDENELLDWFLLNPERLGGMEDFLSGKAGAHARAREFALRVKVAASTFDAKEAEEAEGVTIGEMNQELFNTKIRKEYQAFYIKRKTKADEDAKDKVTNVYEQHGAAGPHRDASTVSWIQQLLQNKAGITDNIFIICDVAYGAIRKDLTFAGRPHKSIGEAVSGPLELRNPRQMFYWMQTPQTLFDPAQKSNLKTDRGWGWRNTPQHTESCFRFAWQNIDETQGGKRNTIYEPWPGLGGAGGAYGTAEELDPNSGEYPNNMLYTNQKLVLTVESTSVENDPWAWDQQSATLLIQDPRTGKMTAANKDSAAKTTKANGKTGVIMSIIKKGNKLVRALIAKLAGVSEADVGPSAAIHFTSAHHVLAKRLGDATQAVACAQTSIPYMTSQLMPKARKQQGMKGDVTGHEARTNGNHMFVSYDRIAVVQALIYKAPIVYYDQAGGDAVIFIKHDLMTLCTKYKQSAATNPITKLMDGDHYQSYVGTIDTFGWWRPVDSGRPVRAGGISDMIQTFLTSQVNSVLEKPQVESDPDASFRTYTERCWLVAPLITALGDIENRIAGTAAAWENPGGGTIGQTLRDAFQKFFHSAKKVRATANFQTPFDTELGGILIENSSRKATGFGFDKKYSDQPTLAETERRFDNLADISVQVGPISPMPPARLDGMSQWEQLTWGAETGYWIIMAVSKLCIPTATNRFIDVDEEGSFVGLLNSYHSLVSQMENYTQLVKNLAETEIPLLKSQLNYKVGESPTRERYMSDPPSRVPEEYLPKGIFGNIQRLAPLGQIHEAVQRTGRSAAKLPTPLQRQFGEAFYTTRNRTYQLDTLLRPLWDLIKNSKLQPHAKEAFRASLKEFAQTIAVEVAAKALEKGLPQLQQIAGTAMAGSAAEQINKMLYTPEQGGGSADEGHIAQSGGGDDEQDQIDEKAIGVLPPVERDLTPYWDAVVKVLGNPGSPEDGPFNSALFQPMEWLDDFYRVFAAILYSQYEVNPEASIQFSREESFPIAMILRNLMNTIVPETEDTVRLGEIPLEELLREDREELAAPANQPLYLFNALDDQLDTYGGPFAPLLKWMGNHINPGYGMESTPFIVPHVVPLEEFEETPIVFINNQFPEDNLIAILMPAMHNPKEWGEFIQSVMSGNEERIKESCHKFLSAYGGTIRTHAERKYEEARVTAERDAEEARVTAEAARNTREKQIKELADRFTENPHLARPYGGMEFGVLERPAAARHLAKKLVDDESHGFEKNNQLPYPPRHCTAGRGGEVFGRCRQVARRLCSKSNKRGGRAKGAGSAG